jgi:hypothetical protein
MLSRLRPGPGEMEVPPEALVVPASGHAFIQGGVSIVVGMASCEIHVELLPGRSTKAELRRGEVFSEAEVDFRRGGVPSRG